MAGKRSYVYDYEFIAVPAGDVREGDLYANGATITRIERGPVKARPGWVAVPKSKVRVHCGDSFAHTLNARDGVLVVGRKKEL